jgi:hypothetical protein
MGTLLKLINGGRKDKNNIPPIDDFDKALKIIQTAKEKDTLECVGLIFRTKTANPEPECQVHYVYSGDAVLLVGLLKCTMDKISAETMGESTYSCPDDEVEDEEY